MVLLVILVIVIVVVGVLVAATRPSTTDGLIRASNELYAKEQAVAVEERPSAPPPTEPKPPRRAEPRSPQRTTPIEPLQWYGPNTNFDLQGFRISNPCTYVGSVQNHDRNSEPSQIDRSLPVRQAATATPLPYWPSYANATPEQRCIYLAWLGSDRKKLPPEDGYLFVFYYGLERRVLVDQSDFEPIFTEIQRLRAMHAAQSRQGPRGSFQHYSTELLWYLVCAHPDAIRERDIEALAKETRTWTEQSVAAVLGWYATNQHPLPPGLALIVAEQSTHSKRSVVLKRVREKFEELYTKRYEQEFGSGLLLRSAKAPRTLAYRPASSALGSQKVTIPNPAGLPSQFRKLSDIWNQCVDDLRKLSTVVKDKAASEMTLAAWEAMPKELKTGTDHPLAESIYELVERNTDDKGGTFFHVADVATLMGIEPREKLTLKQSRKIAETVEEAGFAVEPDARLSGQPYEREELLAVFPHAYEGEPDRERYIAASSILRFGVEVAEADEAVKDLEVSRIVEHVENAFQLNDHERRRCEALRSLLAKTGSDITGLGRKLKAELSEADRRAIGRLLVVVAGADGTISKAEITALRRCYKSLGLSPDEVDNTLRELAPPSDDAPVTVLEKRPGPKGEEIPPPPPSQASVKLDKSAIMRIMAETREVSGMLLQAMTFNEDDSGQPDHRLLPSPAEPTTSKETAIAEKTDADSPPARFLGFYAALLAQERWTKEDAQSLARSHGHMLSGALEAINEWAFDALGSQLIHDDGDSISIERSLLG